MKRVFNLKILLVISIMFFAGCQNKKEDTKEIKEVIKSVFVIKPKLKGKVQNRLFNATASSHNQIKLSFKVQGHLDYFKLQLGDEIIKDDLIAKLDSKPYELRVSQIEHGLSEVKIALQNAKSTLERMKKVYLNKNVSESEMDNVKATYDALIAKVKNVSKELEYAKLQLSYTKLYAPISGYISVKYVQENENVTIGAPIVLLSDKVVDEVRVYVPESYINKIKIDDEVRVVFNSLNSKEFKARISEISKYASQNTKTYLVVVKLEKSTDAIKSGMSADVYFNIADQIDNKIYCIPSNSVLNDKDGYFVYVVKKEDEKYFIQRVDISVGQLTNRGYEVIHGLTQDDLVLKAGMSEVFPNMQVVIGNLKDLGD